MSRVTTPLFINGQKRDASTGATYEVHNPSTGQVVNVAAAASSQDCIDAIESAEKAFHSWKKTSPGARATIFRKAAGLFATDKYKEQILNAVVAETAVTPVWGAYSNIGICESTLTDACNYAYELKGEILPSDFGAQSFVMKRPMGVIFIISPWNAPLGLTIMTTIPAIAAGNAVVLKTSEFSPGSQLIAADILKEAGLPDGVLNVIHTAREDSGPRVAEIIAHPAVRKIGFTGSDRVGKIIAAEAAKHLKPCIFELGGKAPAIVLSDANVSVAARAIVSGAFSHSGQMCVGTERVIVQREIYEDFMGQVKQLTENIKAGDTQKDPSAKLGPVFHAGSAENIIGMVREAVESGAELIAGDLKVNGAFVQPHIVLGTKPGARLWDRESFGPVMTIAVVDTVDEAIELANASTYSLSSSLWTQNMALALELAERIRAGKVFVNGITYGTEARFHQQGMGGTSGYGTFSPESFVNEQLVTFHPENKYFLVDF